VYITVSTGVGGGWILNGRPGMVQRDGRRNCHGCRPSWATLLVVRGDVATGFGTAIAQQVRECLQHSPERDSACTLVDNLEAIAGQIVSQAATQGDELANEVLELAGRWGGHW